jgi:hypothetical protein
MSIRLSMKPYIQQSPGNRYRAGALSYALPCLTFTLLVLLPITAMAQPCGGYDGHGAMMGSGTGALGWISLLISWLVGVAAIVALLSVAVFLLRRSKI